MPEDFLRVVLNQKQVNENNDSALAQRLQYGLMNQNQMDHQFNMMGNHIRPRMLNDLSFARGKLQIDVMEAKLTKNYGFTKMDPYVRIRLGTKVFETPTDYNGKSKLHRRNMCTYFFLLF